MRVLMMAILAMLLPGCDQSFGSPEWRWNQKPTVPVLTPEGMKSGSAVTSARIAFPPKRTGVGDAVVVVLGQGRHLFALLKDYNEWTAYLAFFKYLVGKPLKKEEMFRHLDRLVASTGQSRELSRDQSPLRGAFGWL